MTTDSGAESAALAEARPDPQPGRSPSASACEPYREVIELGLSRGRNAMAIWQDLVDSHGFAGGYQSVKRFVRKLRGSQSPEARAVIETAPGEEAQVDYGTGPMVRDPQTGKYRRTRLFVLTLGYSRKSVRLLVFRSSSQIWAELHEKAFRRLGGVDSRRGARQSARRRAHARHLRSHAQSALPRRAAALRRRRAALPRARSGSQGQGRKSASATRKKTPLKGQRFESLEEAQAYLDHWEERWADTRIHGTTKRQVAAMFAEEKPALLPLPLEPFRYYQYGERTVHLDGCVEVEAAYYSAPPGWIGRRVQVQWDAPHVRLLDPQTGQLLREHLRQERGRHRIQDEDRPQTHAARRRSSCWRAPTQPARRSARSAEACIGSKGEVAVRRILGVLSLAKKYGAARVDDACAVALETGVCDYRFVRRYLERHPQLPLSLRQVDPLIRQLTLYRDLIENKTTGERTMNLIELERALRQLRLGGMAAVLETRLRQAQAEAMAPIDLISCLVSGRTDPAQRPAARAPPQTGRLPRPAQDARQLRLHLQPEDESQSGLRSGHRAPSSASAKTRCFSAQAAPARVTWPRPSARPPFSRATACCTAKRTCCSMNWPTPSPTARARSSWNR